VTTRTRRQLGILVAAIGIAAVAFVLRPATAPVGGGSATASSAAGRQAATRDAIVGDIRLELLESRSTGKGELARNLFRFESRRAPSTTPRVVRGGVTPVPPPTGPPPPVLPPPPPPIPLRYIGYVDQPGQVPRVGVLSDGRGNVFNGREGDIIEGRYRVLRIGTDSADLIYVDGRGRQTIRLSGQ